MSAFRRLCLLVSLALIALAGCTETPVPHGPFGQPMASSSTSATPLWISNGK